ncbi:hypothetical protein GCM10025857_56270 [Alicyclobacillus contaminans]|uniref:Tagatose-bisphosphate aldolase n=1 Tax=Tetragenococcus osmophilus TaxID=526944 RepID=A0AA38CXY2_9ENTE|nr:hypothetical protein GCM10025857_56270 [Alicyclobacillus contaminans]GMA71860.1 hypothetical protein GCM10025885_09090 [Tetragenococcus osmophilus]
MNKQEHLNQLMNEEGIISALAIDQRGAIKKMIAPYKEPEGNDISDFKSLVATELTPYTSSILLDPEYGLPAAGKKPKVAVYYLLMKNQAMMRQRLVAYLTYLMFGPSTA